MLDLRALCRARLYAPYARNLWVAVALVGLAAAAHQGWSANLFDLSFRHVPGPPWHRWWGSAG